MLSALVIVAMLEGSLEGPDSVLDSAWRALYMADDK
jgi:hypothetical protein